MIGPVLAYVPQLGHSLVQQHCLADDEAIDLLVAMVMAAAQGKQQIC
jgi:hypothetical protein